MKKIHNYNLWLIIFGWVLLMPSLVKASGEPNEEATQIIEKTYDISPTDIVEVRNKYGKVSVKTWEKDYLAVKITILARGSSAKKAEEKLDEVAIRERSVGMKVQFETRIDNTQLLPISGASSIKVSYEIQLPASNPIEIENKFGDVELDTREGNVDVVLSYGDFYADQLLGAGNNLHLQFGKTDIRYLRGGDIDFSFGNFHLDEAEFIYLKSNASQIEINKVQSLELYANLGEIRVDEAGEITGNYTSSKFTLGKLNQSLEMEVKYAPKFEVREVSAEVEKIDLEGNFSSFHIYLNPDANVELDATMENGEVMISDPNLEVDSVMVEKNQTHYQSRAQDATARQARPPIQVRVQNKFGNLKVYRKDEE